MNKPYMWVFLAFALALPIACGEVTETGGDADADAGAADADSDAHDVDADPDADDVDADPDPNGDAGVSDPCEEPPTALCGEPTDATCPPREPDHVGEVFPSLETLGVLLPTQIAGGDGDYGATLAASTSPVLGSGHGTAVALAMREDGDIYRPQRIDVPLDDLTAAEPRALPAQNGGGEDIDLAEEGEVTSVAAARLEFDDARIGFIIGDREGEQTWRGHADFVSQETQIDHEEIDGLWDAVGADGRFHYVRFEDESDGPTLRGRQAAIDGPPSQRGTDDEVPGDEDLRMKIAASDVIMLQDRGERFWFWNTAEPGVPVGSTSIGDADGKAAWIEGAEEHLLAYHEDGSIVFRRYECPDGGVDGQDTPCVPAPITGPPENISTNAPSGEALDGLRLPDDRVGVLITEHHDEGDRLILQLVEENLQSLAVPRIPIVDFRDAGLRVTDAALDLAQTDDASTLAITAAAGPERDGADRVIMTGVRACDE